MNIRASPHAMAEVMQIFPKTYLIDHKYRLYMKTFNVSVVIPTCDRFEYLCESINSVLNQTVQAEEIIVIDNGYSAVDPNQLPTSEKVKVIRALPRFGVSQARNLGAILSKGEYISFLDDDDCWDTGYLEAVQNTFLSRQTDIVLGRLKNMSTLEPIAEKQAEFKNENELIKKILRRNPGAVGSNTSVKREMIANTHGYDPHITTNEDKALVLDLLLKGAKAARAEAGWILFRDDGIGPRQTDLYKRIEGKARFVKKYRKNMSLLDYCFNLIQLIRLRLHLIN